MRKKIVICRNSNLEKRENMWDLSRRDLDAGCMNCYFMASYKGQHYTEDWAHCTAPVKVKYGDKMEIIPVVPEKVKRISTLEQCGEGI